MNPKRVISTALLFLLFGTSIPAFAQNAQDDKGGTAPATPQTQPQPTRVSQVKDQPQPSRVPQAQPEAQPTPAPQAQSQMQPTPTPLAEHRAQPTRAQTVQPQPTASNSDATGNQYGRISNANYSAHFGQGHSFHMMRPRKISGYNRFQYGGYWFGFNQGWPLGWSYGDTCYLVYDGGAYYLYDLSHPGIHISLNVF